MPPTSAPATDWGRIVTALNTAAVLAPIGGRNTKPSAGDSFVSKFWSRMHYAASQLFTSKQKRYNLELIEAVQGLYAAVGETQRSVTAGLDCLQSQVNLLKEDMGRFNGYSERIAALQTRMDQIRNEFEPPHFRPNTMDRDIWNGVVNGDEYRLPEYLGAEETVVDVGGHVGSFSYACLMRGAGKVYTFEANPHNYAQILTNLSRFGARSEVFHKAVWRSDEPAGILKFVGSYDPANTGGGGVAHQMDGIPVPSICFDDFLAELPKRTGRERIRLLKMDCEGSEFPILLTSKKLHLVDEIVGEFHEYREYPAVPDAYTKSLGETRLDRWALKRCLEKAGFTVELEEKHDCNVLGMMYAKRKK